MKLSETIKMMNSEDYKERFIAEYCQVRIRINGLSRMLEKMRHRTLGFTPKCSYELLQSQFVSMAMYAQLLEQRAEVEEIELPIV